MRREQRQNTGRDSIQVRSEFLIVNDGVVPFHQLRFDITKYPFLFDTKYGRGCPNLQCGE